MGFGGMLCALLEKDILIRKVKRSPLGLLFLFVVPIIILELMRAVLNPFSKELKEYYVPGTWQKGQSFEPLGPFHGKQKVEYENLLYVPKTDYSDAVVHGAFKAGSESGQDQNPLIAAGTTVPIMMRILREHVKYFKPRAENVPSLSVQAFPTGPYYTPPMLGAKQEVACFSVLLLGLVGYTIFFIDFCNKIIADKESRFKELLKMMGMSDAVYWVNATCVALSIGFPLCLISAIQLVSSFGKTDFISYSSITIVLTTLVFFVIGTVLIILLLSVICQSARAGSIALVIYLFCSEYLFFHWFGSTNAFLSTPNRKKLLSSLIPTHAFNWSVKIIFAHEANRTGSHWSNLFDHPSDIANISLGTLFFAQIASWIFWAFIILYIDAVNPWQHGIPKHPLFFLQFCPCWPKPTTFEGNSRTDHKRPDRIEPMPAEAGAPVIRVVRVTHSFGDLKAIDNLSLDLYKNQISVLLGHNGAGKTTIMNIMTGLFPPDEGDIFINNHSITKSTKKARESIGLCPQHNVLFDYLTVEEHLWFFSKLKGARAGSIRDDINRVLGKIGLIGKKNELSAQLSGGMKRKLSLANAAIGGSKILILDEPSSGLDPEARRSVWDFLSQERQSRTILMTTHHMEEADVLGDRVILLARGRLMSAGSPMFLKKIFETGYKIRVAKEGPQVETEPILSVVKDVLQDSSGAKISLVSDMGFEIVINIGFPKSEKMIEIFKKLESEKADLRITNIGASVTTMEDVFVKVGEIDEAEAEIGVEPDANAARIKFEGLPSFQPLTGLSAVWRQIGGLWWKRFHSLKREWKFVCYTVLWPFLFMYLFVSLIQGTTDRSETPKLSLMSLFGKTRGFVAGHLNDFSSRAKQGFVEEGVDFVAEIEDSDEEITKYLIGQHNKSESEYRNKWSVGLSNDKLWFNGFLEHLAGAALAQWQSTALTEVMGKGSKVDVSLWPLSAAEANIRWDSLKLRIFACGLITSALSMMAGPTISYPVSERQTKSKLLQLMTGVNPVIFHGVSFLFDFTVQALASGLLLGYFLYENPGGCFSNNVDTFRSLAALFLSYAAAMIPLAHLLSFFFSESGSAATIFISLNIVPGVIAGALLSILDFLYDFFKESALKNYLSYIELASWHPTFSVMWGTANIILNGFSKKLCLFVNTTLHHELCEKTPLPSCCQPCKDDKSALCYEYQSSFSIDTRFGAGYQMKTLLQLGAICTVLVILSDYNFGCLFHWITRSKPRKKQLDSVTHDATTTSESSLEEAGVDADVAKEKQVVNDIVAECRTALYSLVAFRLNKRYGSFTAVSDVSFHVPGNECFGLLGVNGAGKTTTFAMLTGDIPMSGGDAFIKEFNIGTSPRDYRRQIGYCPQFDALQASTTCREQLELFCALRVIPKRDSKTIIQALIKMTGILSHIDKQTQKCSGGNKRKLSLALALVGNPAILFLDEPTAGVDPSARKRIYNTLALAQKELNTAVVLTSHSMEVCEALCSKVAIMVGGNFRCLGPTQYLKSKYGTGFTIQVKVKEVLDDTESELCEAMDSVFGGKCSLKQSRMTLFLFHVNDTSLKWSEVFEKVQELRKRPELALDDVQVSDVTLDELFLSFGKS